MIKDIMVHLDGSSEDEIRLEHAQVLGAAGQAHLIGLFTNALPDLAIMAPTDGGAPAVMQILAELQEQAGREGEATAKRLEERLGQMKMPSELLRLDETFGVLSTKAAELARCADIFVATRPYGETDVPVWKDLVETVLFGGGRALLLVPPGYRRQQPAQSVLVAWNGSREAARALREGMDLMKQAKRVCVLLIDPPQDAAAWTAVERHLSRHGIEAEVVKKASEDRDVADVILGEARRVSADLVVMGGYGHTRLRERVFGGATKDMLTVSEIPVLLAH